MMVKPVTGNFRFSGGLFRGVRAVPDLRTPGAENSVAATEVPPFIDHVDRFPREPSSADTTWLTAHVRSSGAATVTLNFSLGESGVFEKLEMFDDGMHRDGRAGDGVYGQQLSPLPHNTQLRYWITATRGDSSRDFPHLKLPGAADPRRTQRGQTP